VRDENDGSALLFEFINFFGTFFLESFITNSKDFIDQQCIGCSMNSRRKGQS